MASNAVDNPVTDICAESIETAKPNDPVDVGDLNSQIESKLSIQDETKSSVTEQNETKSSVTEQNKTLINNTETLKRKISLPNLTYKENQWSPENTAGKKMYDIDFLRKLQSVPNSLKKPENTPNLELVVERMPRNHGDGSRGFVSSMKPNNDLLPGFARGTRNVMPGRRSQGKPTMRNNGPSTGNQRQMIQVSLSLRSDVKLNETENAWRPARLRSVNLEEEERETQEINKKFRSVLNKLTPQMFDKLMVQVKELKIDSEERLKGVIKLVFDKALDEPNFSVTYALMCKELEQIKVKSVSTDSKEEKLVSFRALLISRCQREFEKADDQAIQKQKEYEECTDPDKKKELQLSLEEEERLNRKRSVGNVRFIGELFKQNLITSNIMVYCITRLLAKIEEETLECLCKLLTTIGKTLEKSKNINLEPYFTEMQAIIDKKYGDKISSRVRFMLQDVIELRVKNWVPRQIAANSNPKTIDQIMMEAEMEQMASSYHNNFSNPPPSNSRREERPTNMNKRRGGSKSVTDEGWHQAPSRGSRSKPSPYTVDSEKLRMMTAPITQTSLQPSSTISWERGANTIRKDNSYSSPRHNNSQRRTNNNTTESPNMYNVLLQDSTPDTLPPQKPGSFKSKGASIEQSTFKSNYNEGRNNNSLDIYDDDVSRKIQILMDQYNGKSCGELYTTLHTEFFKNDVPVTTVLKEIILWGLQSNKIELMNVIGETTGLIVVKDRTVKMGSFLDILTEAINNSMDLFLEGDETLWDTLSSFVWGHISANEITLKPLHKVLEKLLKVGKGFDFLVSFFTVKTKIEDQVELIWTDSNMQLTDWFSETRVEEFKNRVPLKCFGKNIITNPEAALTQLITLMREKTPLATVDSWIQERIGDEQITDNWFIRVLTEAVYTYTLCLTENPKPRYDDEAKKRLELYYPLLITYVGCDEKREIQCLFAIQHLMTKLEHPLGITLQIFENLWESGEVISNDGFLTWETNSDPHEKEGKGVMLMSLTSFFTAMKSCDGSSDETDDVIDDSL